MQKHLKFKEMGIIKYTHHGVEVSTQEALKGLHRAHCLCFAKCKHFKPNSDENCEIAQANFQLCIKYHITTPVFECPKYEAEESKL